MYADFECLLVPSDNGGTKHIPCGYAAIRVATDPGHNGELERYSEPGSPGNIVDHFLEYLEKQDKFAQEILSVNQSMQLTFRLPTFFVTRTTKGGGSYDPPPRATPRHKIVLLLIYT